MHKRCTFTNIFYVILSEMIINVSFSLSYVTVGMLLISRPVNQTHQSLLTQTLGSILEVKLPAPTKTAEPAAAWICFPPILGPIGSTKILLSLCFHN